MSADTPAGRHTAKAFDVRTIIALLFVIYGVVLTAMGIFQGAEKTEVNLNLWSGLGMLVFSLLMGGWVLLKPLNVPDGGESESGTGSGSES
ncbi:hypothetical protein [Streptomonospora litoralis]|uniref:Uncharacterized protein n=1 Tax=Streptomonospora litoralis TaxID=2498135 RepID=A0A4P6Q3E3_9ACTN|nr:hypothetical protein [Streptomonospora litoralis]QBI55198.1 hypothetical protein EKD16_17150 [Streptomonospora litoralis]